ncbi:CBS domain-containing protein [Pseudomonas sp. C27(2019)]|uniref:CBS domain-containing protein n=1 Tax=Pseudomonas sp. C27(2019) TaxID=2604941 RepID=UPI001245ACD5|nr:CBS domain-containing protein [Pseudomonas sp. C27(2019)]QEY58239.1 CBS domain-containing protein [Pseudomonas sp. C27(2019)]
MKVSEWLVIHPVLALTIAGDSSLDDAARLLLHHPEGRDIFVLDAEGRVCGHLGFCHLASLLLAELSPAHSLREMVERITLGSVAEHMDDRVLCAGLEEDVNDLLHQHDIFQLHEKCRVEDIPVVDDERRLLGVIRLADLLRAAINEGF